MNKKIILIGSFIIIAIATIYSVLLPKAESSSQIKLNPDVLFNIGNFGITNTMTATWATMLILLIIALFVRVGISIKPKKTQLVMEMILNFFHEKLTIATGNKKDTAIFLPMIITIFLLFLIGNQFSLLPVISSMTFDGIPLFKTPSADFSLTIAATLLILGVAQLLVISRRPIRHFLNFVKIDKIFGIRKLKDVPNTFLEVFLGAMDIIGEIAKVISMSARLFGNVAAGELMILVISGLAVFTVYFVPLPFIFLSSFSGLVQAFVFGLLGVQFSALTLSSIKDSSK